MDFSIESQPLQRRLGYRFKDLNLLRRALTHASHGGENYERLEFLGDAVLGAVISEALYRRVPDASCGELTFARAHLVRKETLSEIAAKLCLDDHVVLGRSAAADPRKSFSQRLRADILEALVGALYLDGGQAACVAAIERLFGARLDSGRLRQTPRDPKSRLQELLQRQGRKLPDYVVIEPPVPGEALSCLVECRLDELSLRFRGVGDSRREAEQQAAESALSHVPRPR